MAFGKGRKKVDSVIEPEDDMDTIEVPADEMMEEGLEQPAQQSVQQPEQSIQQPVQPQPLNQLPTIPPQVQQPVQPTQPVKQRGIGKILSGELIEQDGRQYYRYLILTNRSLGNIGEEFSLD